MQKVTSIAQTHFLDCNFWIYHNFSRPFDW